MKALFKTIITIATLALFSGSIFAAEADSTSTRKGGDLSLGLDLTTTTLWRGTYLGGFAVQPSFGYSIAGFSASVWGSTDFNYSVDGYTELDVTLSYEIAGVTIGLTDYCWTNADGKFDYFGKYTDNHYLEFEVGFDFGTYFEKVPITLSANTMLYGANKNNNDKPAFSSFFTADYSYELKNYVTLGVGIGAALEFNDACLYSPNNGFSVTDIHLGASHDFDIKGKCTIGVGANLMYNPAISEVYFAAGVGFSM